MTLDAWMVINVWCSWTFWWKTYVYQRIPHLFNHDRNQDNPYRPCMVYLTTFTIYNNQPIHVWYGWCHREIQVGEIFIIWPDYMFLHHIHHPKRWVGHQYVVGACPVLVTCWRPQKTTGHPRWSPRVFQRLRRIPRKRYGISQPWMLQVFCPMCEVPNVWLGKIKV